VRTGFDGFVKRSPFERATFPGFGFYNRRRLIFKATGFGAATVIAVP